MKAILRNKYIFPTKCMFPQQKLQFHTKKIYKNIFPYTCITNINVNEMHIFRRKTTFL